jgi:endoglucanase Acf2
VKDLHANAVHVSGYSDWAADMDFGEMTVRVGRGMPFVYAKTGGKDPILTFRSPPTIFRHDGNVLGIRIGATSFGLFCPSGGTWEISGPVLVCHVPPGRNYFSAAVLPAPSALTLYSQFAFSFPENTSVAWEYHEKSSEVVTTYKVTTKAMEGTEHGFLQALYAHQYSSLIGQPVDTAYQYTSPRGPMHVIQSQTFITRDIYHGVLPFLPVTDDVEEKKVLRHLLSDVAAEGHPLQAADTYGLGKGLARIAQMLPLASAAGDATDQAVFKAELKREFGRWFNGTQSHTPPGFFYNCTWGTLIGIPGSYGSADQLNDHHFHYGYWIGAAALLGLYDSSWLHSGTVAPAINALTRDIGAPSRSDPDYPFLRHFDVYAGHSWASGQAPFADGLNEESSSEAINAWAAMILFATETGNRTLRDAAIWMYTLECNAAFDYWFDDGPVRTFPAGFGRVQVANLFDGKSDAGTWFSGNLAMEHGIEFLPFTGASLYLGHDPAYVRRNLKEVIDASGGTLDTRSQNWPDLMEMYLALVAPAEALDHWKRTAYVFDGETRAHEFAWMTSLKKLGQTDWTVTADTPLFAVFRDDRGRRTHVAFNPGATTIQVAFSDGVTISIAPASYAVDQTIMAIR